MAISISQTPFQQALLPASFRGVFFYVQDQSLRSGQRVAEHQYPYRDTPYSEPMGKQARAYVFDGFIVAQPNDDAGTTVLDQYNQLLQAIEADGPGTLVHPILGQLQVVCIGAEFTQNIAGRYIECRLTFVEAGQIVNPGAANDTQAGTMDAADNTQATSSDQFQTDVQDNGQEPGPPGGPNENPAPKADQTPLGPDITERMNPPGQNIETVPPEGSPTATNPSPASETFNAVGGETVNQNADATLWAIQ